MLPGSSNLFGATYKVFGDMVVQQYPDLVPSYAPVNEILDSSFVAGLQQRSGTQAQAQVAQAEKPTFSPGERMRTVVSRKSWQINFDSGRATFGQDAERELQQLLRDTLVASSTAVEVHGHTDSQGNADSNMQLSEERSFAVKRWLEQQSPVNFPSGRIRIFAHGQTNPVAPNSTPDGRAANRRVEIVMGTTD